MTRTGWIRLGLLLTLGVLLLLTAGRIQASPPFRFEQSHEQLRLGMSQEAVHAALGKPQWSRNEEAPLLECWSQKSEVSGGDWILWVSYHHGVVDGKSLQRPTTRLGLMASYFRI
jgi:hypothetical protein